MPNREGSDFHTFFIGDASLACSFFPMNRKEFPHAFMYKAKSCHCYVWSRGKYDVPVLIWQEPGFLAKLCVCGCVFVPFIGQVIGRQIGPTLTTLLSDHQRTSRSIIYHCSTSIAQDHPTTSQTKLTYLSVILRTNQPRTDQNPLALRSNPGAIPVSWRQPLVACEEAQSCGCLVNLPPLQRTATSEISFFFFIGYV